MRQIADSIYDMFFPLEAYQFLGNPVAVTLTGYFTGPPTSPLMFPTPPTGVVGSAGTEFWRKGALFTIAVPVQNGSNAPAGFEAAIDSMSGHVGIPSDATGAVLRTSGLTLFDTGGPDTAMRSNFIAGAAAGSWPTSFNVPDGVVLFGRVHWGDK